MKTLEDCKAVISEPELVGDNTPESLRTTSLVAAFYFAIKKLIKLRFFRKTYVIPSHYYAHGLNREIQIYLLLSNGVLRQGVGKATWVTDKQLYLKKNFWLAKENSYFSLLFYSCRGLQIRHTYYVSSYNEDYFRIEWVSQREESGYFKPSFVNIPDDYSDNSLHKDSSVVVNKNIIFVDDMKPGDSIGIEVKV